MTTGGKKNEEIDVIQLINSIKTRPALYDKGDPMYYSDYRYRYQLWREVCQEVNKNYDKLAKPQRAEYAQDIRKRWRGIRNGFTREVALQKKKKLYKEKGVPFKRRKKYEYFDKLLFLLDYLDLEEDIVHSDSDDQPLVSKDKIEQTTIEMEDVDSDDQVSAHNGSDNFKDSPSSQIKLEAPYTQPIQYERPLEYKLLDMFRETRSSENDDDRMFALSLVPIFRNLNPEKKMEARVGLLKLLHNYQNVDVDQCSQMQCTQIPSSLK